VKEFVGPSTQLEFDEFDDTAVDEEQLEGKGSVPPLAEGAGEGGREENAEEDEELESKSEKKSRPPTVDEYQWQWKVSYLGSRLMLQRIEQMPQPQLETTRRTFFL